MITQEGADGGEHRGIPEDRVFTAGAGYNRIRQ